MTKPVLRIHKFTATLVWLVCFLLGIICPVAAADTIRFDHVGASEGLSNDKINCMVQDSNGYLWFGVEFGLYKYDGYSFTVFKHDPDDPHSLSNSFVTKLCADADGSIWIGTENGEINRFDSRDGQIRRYQLNWASRSGTGGQAIENICIDHDGTVWICMNGNGLAYYDTQRDAFVPYKPASDRKIRLQSSTVLQALDAGSDKLWLTILGQGPALLDKANHTLETRFGAGDTPPAFRQCDSWLLQDSRGDIWLATWGKGLFRCDVEADRVIPVAAISAERFGEQAAYINCMVEDSRGSFWIGTAGAGVFHFDPAADLVEQYLGDSASPHSLSSNFITSIMEDDSGSIWIGSQNGLNKFSRYKYKFSDTQHTIGDRNGSSEYTVLAIYQDRTDNLWIGTAGMGLIRYDRTDGSKEFFRYSGPNSRIENMVNAVYEDKHGELYIGTANSGLLRMDRRTGEFEQLTKPQHVSDVLEDSTGALWIATYVNGLGRLEREDNTYEQLSFVLDEGDRATNFDATVLYEDAGNNLWIGTDGYGLIKLMPDRMQYLHFARRPDDSTSLSDNRVLSICEDMNGALWIGTRYGLNRYDPADNSFTSYFENTVLPDNVICGIRCDTGGALWLSTYNGLARFFPESEQCRGFDMDDGLADMRFSPGVSFKNAAGELFFGNTTGFNIIDPQKLETNPHVPKVVLTSFKKFGYEHELPRPVDLMEEIVLAYNENFFTFEFSALDFADPAKNTYAYQLVGIDKEWNFSGDGRSARYTDVAPGDYEFRVKASNNDGVWNDEGKSVSIRIIPPFWVRWEFRVAMVLLVIFTAVALYSMRMRQVKRQQSALQKEIDERIKVEKRMRTHQKRLRSLASELTLTEERERRRISAALHDRVGHALFLTKMELSALLKRMKSDNGTESTEKIIQRLNDSIKVTRELTVEISPPSLYKFGLEAATESLLERFSAEHNIDTEFKAPKERITLSDEMSVILYQSLRELLLNTLKHAKATSVRVLINSSGDLVNVIVRDNGVGFNILEIVKSRNDMKGFGLFSIQERMEILGGELKISSEPGNGTQITMIAPRQHKAKEVKT